jgi:hypothetical protein
MIKVKANILRDFLKKTTAQGLVSNGKLVFSDKGLNMCHKDEMGVILIAGNLTKVNFVELEACELNVKSMDSLLKVLNTFRENIVNIVVQKNAFRVMDESSGYDIVMAEEVSCFREKGLPEITYDNKTLLKKEVMDKVLEMSGIVKSQNVTISNNAKKLTLQVGEETDKAQATTFSNFEAEKKTVFNIDYFKKLTGDMGLIVDFSMGDGATPSKFEEKAEKYDVTYFITPITETEN